LVLTATGIVYTSFRLLCSFKLIDHSFRGRGSLEKTLSIIRGKITFADCKPPNSAQKIERGEAVPVLPFSQPSGQRPEAYAPALELTQLLRVRVGSY